MSVHRLDRDGNAITGTSRRQPASKRIAGVWCQHYELRYDRYDADGTRHQHRSREWLPSLADAEARERELTGKRPISAYTLTNLWREYYAEYEGKRSPGHLDSMERTVRQATEALGAVPIEQVSLQAMSSFLRRREEEASGRTAQIARSHVLRIARWARSVGLIEQIPWEHVPRPEHTAEHRRAATIEEYAAWADALPSNAEPLWTALAVTGSRLTGMAQTTEDAVQGEYLYTTTKGSKEAVFLLTPPLRDAVGRALAYKADKDISSPYIFVNSRGNPWNKSSFRLAMQRTRKANRSLPKITPHQLRHLHGTIAAELGLSPDQIAAGLGHADRRTSEHYIHRGRSMADQTASAVATYLTHERKQFSHKSQAIPTLPTLSADFHNPLVCPHCGGKFCLSNEKTPSSVKEIDDE